MYIPTQSNMFRLNLYDIPNGVRLLVLNVSWLGGHSYKHLKCIFDGNTKLGLLHYKR
jgi:hypothetical protein